MSFSFLGVTSRLISGCTSRIEFATVNGGLSTMFVAMAILFNPLIPIYATREFSQPVDIVSVILYWVAGVRLRVSKPAAQ